MDRKVDLHLHSYYTDGTHSPAEILKIAEAAGVGTIAITDHDCIEGAKALLSLADKRGIRCLSGVELTAFEKGEVYHILGYGMDLNHPQLNAFLKENRQALDLVSVKLVEKMEKDFPSISTEDFDAYHYDRRKGGWKALHYFMDKGITGTLFESLMLYGRYGQTYENCGFADLAACCEILHQSGGVTVLAHPYKMIPYENLGTFREKLMMVLKSGIDGIECYYPEQPESVTKICLELCQEQKLLVTSGSDSHGEFVIENTPIGTGTVTEGVLARFTKITETKLLPQYQEPLDL